MNCVFEPAPDGNGFACKCGNRASHAHVVISPCRAAPAKGIGLGDMVAAGIKAATFGLVKECGGCKKRKEALNKIRFHNPFIETASLENKAELR